MAKRPLGFPGGRFILVRLLAAIRKKKDSPGSRFAGNRPYPIFGSITRSSESGGRFVARYGHSG
jgi:hypothetical protein